MSETLNLGIDFGTSNSGVASFENDEVRIFRTEQGESTQPSSLFIRVDGYISVSNTAIEDYQNPEQHGDTFHFIPSVKPALPEERYEGNILRSKKVMRDGRPLTRFFPVEELGSILITDMKDRAEQASNREAEGVVLGRPVFFSEDKVEDKLAQDRLEASAREAGFHEVHFVLEPVAAALHYERIHSPRDPHKVFVFDFGGGTLDVSVLNFDQNQAGKDKIRSGDYSGAVLATNGIDLGGTDFDKDVFRDRFLKYFGTDVSYDVRGMLMPARIKHEITEWHLLEPRRDRGEYDFLRRVAVDRHCSNTEAVRRLITLVEDQQVYSILRSIEGAKIQLSSDSQGRIQHNYKNIDIDEPLTKEEFERIILPRIDSIQSCIDKCLTAAQVEPDDIDVALKVGGSSNNLFVDKMLAGTFSGEIQRTDVFTSVTSGLAVAANDILR
jgi:hypothetical chaperone protein